MFSSITFIIETNARVNVEGGRYQSKFAPRYIFVLFEIKIQRAKWESYFFAICVKVAKFICVEILVIKSQFFINLQAESKFYLFLIEFLLL